MCQMVWVHLEAHSKKLMTLMRAGTFIWQELIGNILTDLHRNVMKKSGKICARLHTLDHNFICLMQYYHSSVFNFFGLLSILLVYVQVSKDNILPCEVHRGQVGVQCQHHGIWGHRAWDKSTMLLQKPVDWTGKAITFAVWSRWYNHLWNDWASTVQYNDLKSVNTLMKLPIPVWYSQWNTIRNNFFQICPLFIGDKRDNIFEWKSVFFHIIT